MTTTFTARSAGCTRSPAGVSPAAPRISSRRTLPRPGNSGCVKAMPSQLVDAANRHVPMWVACREAGMDLFGPTSKRTYCPFGEFSHADGGSATAFRVYPDHGFCFACWEYYSPTRLCAMVWEVTEEAVAERLLTTIGHKPKDYRAHWLDLTTDLRPQIDREAVATALKTRCLRLVPDWPERQYDPFIAEYLARCLALLVQVTSEVDARQWLETCSTVMITVLRRSHDATAGRSAHP
jgi:hypothetical protein